VLQPKEGVFRVDKTGYIRKLDGPVTRAILSLRPRHFGKSLWLQTIAKYYNKAYKDHFQDMFGRLDIGKSPTKFHSSYYICYLNFAGLRTDSVGTFLGYIDATIHRALHRLQSRNKELSFEISDKVLISFNTMIDAVASIGGKV
jgi:Predicted AAA-ATPase